jgi:hypothetical protein
MYRTFILSACIGCSVVVAALAQVATGPTSTKPSTTRKTTVETCCSQSSSSQSFGASEHSRFAFEIGATAIGAPKVQLPIIIPTPLPVLRWRDSDSATHANPDAASPAPVMSSLCAAPFDSSPSVTNFVSQ